MTQTIQQLMQGNLLEVFNERDRDKRSEAAGKRAEADRLEELAHAEKEKRQAERAND